MKTCNKNRSSLRGQGKLPFLPTWWSVIGFRHKLVYRTDKESLIQFDMRWWWTEISLRPTSIQPRPLRPPLHCWLSCAVVQCNQLERLPSESVRSDVSSRSFVGVRGSAVSTGVCVLCNAWVLYVCSSVVGIECVCGWSVSRHSKRVTSAVWDPVSVDAFVQKPIQWRVRTTWRLEGSRTGSCTRNNEFVVSVREYGN